MSRKKSHFTIIELLIIIAIIAIIAAMLFPAMNAARTKAYAIQCVSNLKQSGVMFNMYADDFGDYFPSPEVPMGDGITSGTQEWSDGHNWGRRLLVYCNGLAQNNYNNGKKYDVIRCPSVALGNGLNIWQQTYGMNPYLMFDWLSRPSNITLSPTRVLVRRSLAGRGSPREAVTPGNPSATILLADSIVGGIVADNLKGKFQYNRIEGADAQVVPRHGGCANILALDGSVRQSRIRELKETWKLAYYFDIQGNNINI